MVSRRKNALLVTLLSVWWSAGAGAASDYKLKVEPSKDQPYQGESFLAHFVLYAEEDALEVEVAKFPEFRGFWSENLALRQGPVPLLRELPLQLFRRTTVGTYLVSSMVGRADAAIEPMKLVVKKLFGARGENDPEIVLTAEVPPLNLRPLPPVPPELPAGLFRGAVGHFQISADVTNIRFQKDEPTSVRVLLQGEGNFPEINELALQLPPEVELISRRAVPHGSGQFAAKSFDYTLVVHADKDLEVPPVRFAYFDPRYERYEILETPPLRFVFEPKPAFDIRNTMLGVELDEPAMRWSPARPLSKSWFFWIMHVLIAASLGELARRELKRRRQLRESHSPVTQLRKRWRRAQLECQAGRQERFLRLADEIAYEVLRRAATTGATTAPVVMTRREALERAKGKLPDDALESARQLFEAHDRLAYLPTPTAPSDPAHLLRALETLVGRVA